MATAVAQTSVEAGQQKFASAASALSGGDVVVVGERVGVVMGTKPVDVGDAYTVEFKNVYSILALVTDVWDDGVLIYWDATAGNLTDTASSHKTAGIAHGAKANGDTRALVDPNASVASLIIA